MRIIVCVKHAASVGDEVEFTPDGKAVARDFLDFALNEWDAYATEEALRLRDALGGEVVVVSVGDESVEPAIRRCLAMGADRGIRVWHDGLAESDALGMAQALAVAIRTEQADLILCGVQSSDEVSGTFGSALAANLDLPCETCVVGLAVTGDGAADVHRELDGGAIELRRLQLPAVVTVQTGINEPRYATFRAIKQADLKELSVRLAEVPKTRVRTLGMRVPVREHRAEMLVGPASAQAGRIAAILHERLA